MTLIEAMVTLVFAWWIVFFMALPFGHQTEDKPIKGQAMSAPKNPQIKVKMLVTTVLSLIITLILYIVIG